MSEHVHLFGESRSLVGIVTDPRSVDDATARSELVAAIFLNAGVIHRVGPSRLYVHLARAFAQLGWMAVRFDHSGIGDSPVRPDGRSFEESATLEARAVMDALESTYGIRRFALVGLCSGAVTAFETARIDERVVGVVMINPQGFADIAEWNEFVQNRGYARKYWTQSLFSPASWRKALTGRADYRRLARVLWRQATAAASAEHTAPVAERVAAVLNELLRRRVQTLLVCSEGDDGVEYMNVILGQDVRRMPSLPGLTVEILVGADHSFTIRESQRRIVEVVRRWVAGLGLEEGRVADVDAEGRVALEPTVLSV
jgi:pimeloyl-ACP methyl ester carboxylesterase